MTTKHVSLRLNPETHSRLIAAAELNHRSLNGEIEWAIDQHLQSMRGRLGVLTGSLGPLGDSPRFDAGEGER